MDPGPRREPLLVSPGQERVQIQANCGVCPTVYGHEQRDTQPLTQRVHRGDTNLGPREMTHWQNTGHRRIHSARCDRVGLLLHFALSYWVLLQNNHGPCSMALRHSHEWPGTRLPTSLESSCHHLPHKGHLAKHCCCPHLLSVQLVHFDPWATLHWPRGDPPSLW